MPVHGYGGVATYGPVIGGVAYRGCALPGYSGTYFFAGYDGTIHSLELDRATGLATTVTMLTDGIDFPRVGGAVGFGEDALGEIYVVVLEPGVVYKIVER